MQTVRTPEHCFAHLPDFDYSPSYRDDLPALQGLRMAYLDLEPLVQRDSDGPVVLCLHGNPSWGFLYRKMIPVFRNAGLRVVVPDLIGFGRSDKPMDEAAHSFGWHRQILLEFIEAMQLNNILLVVQDWGGLLGLTLPHAMPERFSHLLVMNTALAVGKPAGEGFAQWQAYSNKTPDLPVGKMLARGKPDMSAEEAAGYDAPFPDASFKAALRAFPNLVPQTPQADGAAISQEAAVFWRDGWAGSTFMAVGQQDPVLGPPVMAGLQRLIRGCPAPMEVAEGGHFLQEWGEPIARAALKHFKLS